MAIMPILMSGNRRCIIASGKNHDRAILFTSPIVGIIGVSHSLELGIIAASAHLLGGLYLSPDLDLKSKPFKRWGILRVLWMPYQKLIPCHRHWLSHGVIVGSVVRLLYLAVLLLPLWFLFPDLQQAEWAVRVESPVTRRNSPSEPCLMVSHHTAPQ